MRSSTPQRSADAVVADFTVGMHGADAAGFGLTACLSGTPMAWYQRNTSGRAAHCLCRRGGLEAARADRGRSQDQSLGQDVSQAPDRWSLAWSGGDPPFC